MTAMSFSIGSAVGNAAEKEVNSRAVIEMIAEVRMIMMMMMMIVG